MDNRLIMAGLVPASPSLHLRAEMRGCPAQGLAWL